MSDASPRKVADRGVLVVLVLPEHLGPDLGLGFVRRVRDAAPGPVRFLVSIAEAGGLPLVPALAGIGVPFQVLLGPSLARPATDAVLAQMPPGSKPEEQEDLALALCDLVLARTKGDQASLLKRARVLGTPILLPGDDPSALPVRESATRRLDPEAGGWHAWGRRVFGRLEQGMIALLAFDCRDGERSRRRLRASFGWGWRPRSAPGPDGWLDLMPDRAARDGSTPIVERYLALDRSALHGSYIHRDLIWLAHFGAAFAVFAAVAGQIRFGELDWAIVELVTLLAVAGLILAARRVKLQDRWTACRLGAEQLRIARICLPLLVAPPAFATAEDAPAAAAGSTAGAEPGPNHGLIALAEAKRAIRDQGLPDLDPGFTVAQAACWLRFMVEDQRRYHAGNHEKLARAEARLRFLSQLIFLAAILAVCAEFRVHRDWLLLVTAAGPAFAGALHGAETRLGIVHRHALSERVEATLKRVSEALSSLIDAKLPPREGWRRIRDLAVTAAVAMGDENTSWHSLVRREREEIPN